jgi:hypothetical protein
MSTAILSHPWLPTFPRFQDVESASFRLAENSFQPCGRQGSLLESMRLRWESDRSVRAQKAKLNNWDGVGACSKNSLSFQ